MKRSFLALSVTLALVSSLTSASFAQTNGKRSNVQPAPLAAQLPISDGVVIIDMERLQKNALPQFLTGGKMQILNEMNARADEIKSQTGIDLRNFQQIAVGVTFKQNVPNKITYEPVVLARGTINANGLLAAAKTASKGRYREEKSGAKTIYVFSAREILQATKPNVKTPKDGENLDKMLTRVPAEIAVAVFDDNTLAFGSSARVRETIERKSRISQDLMALASRQPNAIMSFGANTAQGLAPFYKLGDDTIDKNLGEIRRVRGSMDVIDANTILTVAAKSITVDSAKTLEDTLTGFQIIGKGALSGMKGNDKQIYARMAENLKIARASDEVTIDVRVANADINLLLGIK